MSNELSLMFCHPLTDFVARIFALDKEIAALGGIDRADLAARLVECLDRIPNRIDQKQAQETLDYLAKTGWLKKIDDHPRPYHATDKLWRRAHALIAADKMFSSQTQ